MNKLKLATSILVLSTLSLGFQNCSKVGFSSAGADSVASTKGSGDDEDPKLPNIPTDPTQIPGLDPNTPNGRKYINDVYGAQCRLGRLLGAATLADGQVISGHGNLIARIGTNVSVDGFGGNLILFGAADTAAISSVKDFHGNLILCDGNITAVQAESHGNIVVFHGDVGSIDGFHGNLVVLDGDITGNVTNSWGNIIALNYNIHLL